MKAPGSPQRGVILLVTLIMMVLLTLLALTAVNLSSVNLRLVGNEQARSESVAAAQLAIEQVATTNFPANPQPVTVNVDVNRDATADYGVAVAKPVCLNSVPLKTVQLNINNPGDVACFASGAAQNTGIAPAGGGGNSDCSNTQWDLSATTTDNANSGATVTIHQGIGMRVAIGTTC
jgi:Tfp pilus assembly protein PilX